MKRHEPGAVLELNIKLAAQMVTSGRARFLEIEEWEFEQMKKRLKYNSIEPYRKFVRKENVSSL